MWRMVSNCFGVIPDYIETLWPFRGVDVFGTLKYIVSYTSYFCATLGYIFTNCSFIQLVLEWLPTFLGMWRVISILFGSIPNGRETVGSFRGVDVFGALKHLVLRHSLLHNFGLYFHKLWFYKTCIRVLSNIVGDVENGFQLVWSDS